MIYTRTFVTETGGATSHAAVVSRALGKPCVVSCGAGVLDALKGRLITVDGASGRIFDGRLDVVAPDEHSDPWLSQLSEWARGAVPQASPGDGLPALLAAIHGVEIDQETV